MSDYSYYLGQICLFPYTYVPKGFIECNGDPLPIRSYEALFSLLGTKYGGDGESLFFLPDLRKEAPKGMKSCINIHGYYPPRD